MYEFKRIISEHIEQNESLETMINLERKVNLLKRNLKKEEKSKIKFLDLVNNKVKAKINLIRHKERMSNFYMIGKGIFTIISAGCGAAASHFPIFSFILRPAEQGFNFLSYLSWQKAIENDQSVSKEEQVLVRTKLKNIKKHNAGAAITGMLGGALLFISAVIPPIAPITLALGMGVLLISNTLILAASLKDLHREIKYGKKDAGKRARIVGYVFNAVSSISNTIASTLLLTAAILAIAFPPAAMAVAGAFAIIGLTFLAANIVSAVASHVSLYMAHKKTYPDTFKPDLEMDEFYRAPVDFEIAESRILKVEVV